jgi:hypothetical protein
MFYLQKNYKMKIFISFILSLNVLLSIGQAHETKQAEAIPKDYLSIIHEQCDHPKQLSMKRITNDYVRIDFLCDDKPYRIGIKADTLLYVEYGLDKKDFPEKTIKQRLLKKHPGWHLGHVMQVRTQDETHLKVTIQKDGIEQHLYFTNEGKALKTKPMSLSPSIDFKLLEKNKTYQAARYKFHKPDKVYEMPDLLQEISGIALSSDPNIVYCIQDEIGSIFEYHLVKQQISNAYRFTDIGDFEDLAIQGNIIYVLRSDGNLFIYDLKNKTKISETMLQLNSLNIEGLCLHDGSLYVACKDALINDLESKRVVYSVDVNALNHVQPYLEIDIIELSNFIKQHYPETGISKLLFNPSAIAIHPTTKEMYILSASDRFIAIYKEKKLVNVIPLSEEIYHKPEGLSFYPNGDLLISSEGDKTGLMKPSICLVKGGK